MERYKSRNGFRFYDYIRQLVRLIIRDRVPARATSLAYNTILALVPLVAVFISFGSRELLEGPISDAIINTMLPTSQDMIFEQIKSFAENSRKLGAWGLTITMVVIFLLINKIEIDVNVLLRARPNKNIFTRIAIYIGTLVFATLAVGSSFSITNDLFDVMNLELPESFSPLETLLSSLGSMALIALTIIGLMMLVSSAKIPFKSALTGALWGSFLWELAKKGFSFWANYSIRNSVIYGSFFLVPILFIWINLAWIIILSSLEISYLHQHSGFLLMREKNHDSPAVQTILAMEVFHIICRESSEKQKPPHLEDLARETELPEQEILILVNRLMKYDLVMRIEQKGYVPSEAPDDCNGKDLLLAALDNHAVSESQMENRARELWERFMEAGLAEGVFETEGDHPG